MWKVYPSHDAFESCLYRFLPCISQSVEEESGNDDNRGSASTCVDPIMILVRDLLPHASRQLASQALVPNILNTAARRSRTSVSATATTSSTLRIIHILFTTNCSKNDKDKMQHDHQHHEDNEDHDHLFEGGAYFECTIPMNTRVPRRLLWICVWIMCLN